MSNKIMTLEVQVDETTDFDIKEMCEVNNFHYSYFDELTNCFVFEGKESKMQEIKDEIKRREIKVDIY